ncbi:unnamed protein product, partial [Effrenium voratum]
AHARMALQPLAADKFFSGQWRDRVALAAQGLVGLHHTPKWDSQLKNLMRSGKCPEEILAADPFQKELSRILGGGEGQDAKAKKDNAANNGDLALEDGEDNGEDKHRVMVE